MIAALAGVVHDHKCANRHEHDCGEDNYKGGMSPSRQTTTAAYQGCPSWAITMWPTAMSAQLAGKPGAAGIIRVREQKPGVWALKTQ